MLESRAAFRKRFLHDVVDSVDLRRHVVGRKHIALLIHGDNARQVQQPVGVNDGGKAEAVFERFVEVLNLTELCQMGVS